MKKILFSFILIIASFRMASADEPIKGIIATYEGSDTSYKLESVPTIWYETVKGVKYATLYLNDKIEPVLKVVIADGKKLTIVFGEYVPTDINGIVSDKAVITEREGKKFIHGGKLIIIGKDGKMYNAAGVNENDNKIYNEK